MNSRKVRYSCVVVCFSVLLGFSWTAPAVAGDAADLRLAAGPSRGGAGTSTLVPLPAAKAKPAVMPVPASEPWDVLWMDVWKKSNQIYRIGVADTLRQAPGCTGNLGLEIIVEQTIRAIRDRKFGDAVRFMSQFQDRSLCLNYEGARGLDFALSYYTDRAILELPADQQRIAIHGTFNLGMLAFDQTSDTGRSWWQAILRLDYPQMVAQMNAYPVEELGFWFFNFQNGRLLQSISKKALLEMLATLGNPVGGTNTGGGSSAAGSGDSGTGFMAGSAGTGAGVVGCTVAASGSSGPRGIFTCQQKAMAGIRPSVGDFLAGPFDPAVSVRDPQCTQSTDVKPYVPPPDTNKPKKPEPQPKVQPYVAPGDKEAPKSDTNVSVVRQIWGAIKSWFSSTPPPPPPPPVYNYLTAPGTLPGPGGTGGCGNASNAARHMQAVANCLGISSGSPQLPTPTPGEINPHVPAGEAPGAASGKMDCLMQAGSLVRTSAIDPKCAMQMCAPGQACPCEGSGPISQAPQQLSPNNPITNPTVPNCGGVPCEPIGGGTPGNLPPGPMPGPGSTSGAGTTTRGIGTAPLLQQQKGTTPVSPLQQIGR